MFGLDEEFVYLDAEENVAILNVTNNRKTLLLDSSVMVSVCAVQ